MHLILATACAATLALPLAACSLTTPNDTPKTTKSGTVTVTSTAKECTLSSTSVPAGPLVFKVTNKSDAVTEFYLYADDNKRIVAEVENIGPGLSRQLVTTAKEGTYYSACKPGMSGDGIRAKFTVTKGSGSAAGASADVDRAALTKATDSYTAYIKDQSDLLLTRTRAFTTAYAAGDDAKARTLYPVARTPWERIETVAESFGDLDPLTDLREADLEPGQKWTGWHRIEKDLWPPATGYTALTKAQRATYAADLLANITTLHGRVQTLSYRVDQIGNGSKSLLDEVATGKVTGEEEAWSHTDLSDFQANVDGALVGFQGLEPILESRDPELAETLEERFDALQKLLDRYRVGAGFVSYEKVNAAQRKELSDAVNALSEPLSKLTGAVTL